MEYAKDKTDWEFDGIISGVTAFGIFVRTNIGLEGLVHKRKLLDDKYYYYAIKAGNGQEIGRSCYYKEKDEMEKDFTWLRSNKAQLIKVEEEKT